MQVTIRHFSASNYFNEKDPATVWNEVDLSNAVPQQLFCHIVHSYNLKDLDKISQQISIGGNNMGTINQAILTNPL